MANIKDKPLQAPNAGADEETSTLNEPDGAGLRAKAADPEKASSRGETEDGGSNGAKEAGAQPAPAAAPGLPNVPDGGWEAWLLVFGTWCTSFCSFGWINSVGIFQEYYQTGPLSHYSSSTISWIPSLQIFFMMAMGPIVGGLFDKYGPRYIILAGTLLDVFGLMMASISKTYYQFLLSQGVCSAIGVAAIFQPALSCIPGYFNKRRGLAYGILSTGSSVGGVIFPIMVSRLIAEIGYGWAMRTSAFLILALLVCANLTVRSRFHGPGRPAAPKMTPAEMAAPLREPGFLLLLLGMFLLTFGIFVPITYISVDALATGTVSPSLAQYLVSTLNATSLFGRLLAGWAADKLGKFNVFLAACTLAGISVLALWIPGTNRAATIAFPPVFGFFSGAYISLIASLVAQVSPRKEIGYRSGLVFLVGALPGLTTSPIAGAILAHGQNWVGVKVFSGVMLLAGSAATLLSRFSYAGFGLRTVF